MRGKLPFPTSQNGFLQIDLLVAVLPMTQAFLPEHGLIKSTGR
jgi:hypothetical protein